MYIVENVLLGVDSTTLLKALGNFIKYTHQAFDYITFYPKNKKAHTAI
jgi:hypothetical protein